MPLFLRKPFWSAGVRVPCVAEHYDNLKLC